jgi:eukaryotic-like serine/threonine-protein kinase
VAAEVFVPTAGELVAERYQLRRVIGSGGMGQVWEAYDQQLESSCAIKFILEHMAQDASVRSRFAREAKAVAALRSPHAVQILGIGEHGDALYIAMELLEGETLRARLNRSGRLDEPTTLTILQQVGHALEKARIAGIVHRDLKPENIWLWAGQDVFAKILDFGVAKSLVPGNSLQTATGALLGTPYYMSPEQARGNHDVDHRSDLWSLSIIALECLGGRRPYQSDGLGDLLVKILTTPAPPLTELAPHLPASLRPWWEKALARKADERFQTAAELVESLRAGLASGGARPHSRTRLEPSAARSATIGWPIVAGSVSPLSGNPAPKPQRRRLGLALAGIALVLGSITAWRLSSKQETATLSPAPAASPLPEAPAAPSVAPPASSASRAQADGAIVVRPISAPEPKNAPSTTQEEEDELFVGEARAVSSRDVQGKAPPGARPTQVPGRSTRPRSPVVPPARAASPKPPAAEAKPADAPAPKPAAPANDYGF